AGDKLVVAVAFPVLEVVEDLERDAEMPAELCDELFIRLGRASEPQPRIESRLERRGRLEGVNLQGIQGSQRLVLGIAPEQFGTLPIGQLHMRVGQAIEDVRGTVTAQLLAFAADQAIAEADQVIADVDGS